MEQAKAQVPEHVPAALVAQYGRADPHPRLEKISEEQLARIERSSRRDVRLLSVAVSLCMLLLVVTLAWVALSGSLSGAGAVLATVVVVAVFALCIWLARRGRRQLGC
jgi:FtsH-binding integral membrane protein